eukprot:3454210-Amphidinium_carterae.1
MDGADTAAFVVVGWVCVDYSDERYYRKLILKVQLQTCLDVQLQTCLRCPASRLPELTTVATPT